MDKDIRTWLEDIRQSIEEIEGYFEPGRMIFEEYVNDTRTKRAVERNLEIIGEAVVRILRKEEAFDIQNARKIVGTRNRIIHGYDAISDNLIWGIVVNHLPKLKIEVESLLVD